MYQGCLPHLLKYRFVVVDIINPNDDPGSRRQRVWSARGIVICGRYIQDVLQTLKLGQGSRAETDQSCKEHRPLKLLLV